MAVLHRFHSMRPWIPFHTCSMGRKYVGTAGTFSGHLAQHRIAFPLNHQGSIHLAYALSHITRATNGWMDGCTAHPQTQTTQTTHTHCAENKHKHTGTLDAHHPHTPTRAQYDPIPESILPGHVVLWAHGAHGRSAKQEHASAYTARRTPYLTYRPHTARNHTTTHTGLF